MVKLQELLSLDEDAELRRYPNTKIPIAEEVKNLTIEQLSVIGMVLIKHEYFGRVPGCVISAEAINILTNRAIKNDKPIF